MLSETSSVNGKEATSHEVAENNLFPVFLKLEQFNLLLVGGGFVAIEKLEAILKNSPKTKIKIVATIVNPLLRKLVQEYPNITINERPYQIEDLEGMDIVISAIDDPQMTEVIREHAKNNRLLINAADRPKLCDFYLGSIVNKGQLKIAISTNGKSPTVAKRIREALDEAFPIEINDTLENVAQIKKFIGGTFASRVTELNKITSSLSEEAYNNQKKAAQKTKMIISALMILLFSLGLILGKYVL